MPGCITEASQSCSREDPRDAHIADAHIANALTEDEARRIAENIATCQAYSAREVRRRERVTRWTYFLSPPIAWGVPAGPRNACQGWWVHKRPPSLQKHGHSLQLVGCAVGTGGVTPARATVERPLRSAATTDVP